MSNRTVKIHATWRCTMLGAAMAATLLAPAAAWAAVPPSSNVQAAIGNPAASKIAATQIASFSESAIASQFKALLFPSRAGRSRTAQGALSWRAF